MSQIPMHVKKQASVKSLMNNIEHIIQTLCMRPHY